MQNLDAEGLVGADERLIRLQCSPDAGVTPDGEQDLQPGGGWMFTLENPDSQTERIEIGAQVLGPEPDVSRPECAGQSITVDGISADVKTAVEHVTAQYGVDFAPGTWSIFLARETACMATSGLARTVVEFQLDNASARFVTAEFDGNDAFVGLCEVGGQLRGCRQVASP
jgi:hypothetical protein